MNSKVKSIATSGAHHLATTGPTTALAAAGPASMVGHSALPPATSTPTTASHKSESHKKKPTSAAKHAVAKKPDDYVSQVDFSTMEDKVLKRYKRTFKLRAKSSRERDRETRDDLVSSVTKHFHSHEVNEKDTITFFIYTLRNQDNVYKLPAKAPIASS